MGDIADLYNEDYDMTSFENTIVALTGTFIHKTEKAVALRLEEGNKIPVWIPMSQIYTICHEDGVETDYNNLEIEHIYIWDISGWIALKLFDVESMEELDEADLSYVEIR